MKRYSRSYLAAGLLAAGALLSMAGMSAAQGKQTFTGKITDDDCPLANHEAMQMGNDRECTIGCVETHGASYVLYDGAHAYRLSDQKTPREFAGQKVTVTGTLDAKTSMIQVASMVAAK